ncbi:MAG: dTDP-4-dehydrorhamnose reductase [Betaproteobacteria bacterium]|nr:dTDP-4-dehydrorhamnose reductase [Betaproteobacteria bacterium]
MTPPTILLLGKDGQVGRELQRTLLPLGNLIAKGEQEADLGDLDALQALLEVAQPNVIVNAAAYTAVDKAESDAATAFRINAEAVEVLACYARQANTLLVHYSTDYVFDGTKSGAYLETDLPQPLSVYGRSKRAGEEVISTSGCDALIFRTSWAFSQYGGNFIKTILGLARERESLNVVADQFGAPTSAELIGDVTALAISGFRTQILPAGLYHLTASGETSWHGLARHVVQRAKDNGITLALDPECIIPVATDGYPLPAPRPKNSRLDTLRLTTRLNITLPDWAIHANRTIDQLTLGGYTK